MSDHAVIIVLASCLALIAVARIIEIRRQYKAQIADIERRRREAAQSVRQVHLGETFDLAPHERAEVVAIGESGAHVFVTVDGGPSGIKGARIG